MTMMQFKIEQIALAPADPEKAIKLLTKLGLHEWARDIVVARGTVFGKRDEVNVAELAFNYQASREGEMREDTGTRDQPKPLELEVLSYKAGDNWLKGDCRGTNSVSHIGMHCTMSELTEWKMFFRGEGIGIAQEVNTQSHTNPAIAGQRWYRYCIFDTVNILGVDLKFIVRLEKAEA